MEALVERRTCAVRGSGRWGGSSDRGPLAARGGFAAEAPEEFSIRYRISGFDLRRAGMRARRASIRTCAGLATAMVIAEAIVTVNEVDEARDGDVYVRA